MTWNDPSFIIRTRRGDLCTYEDRHADNYDRGCLMDLSAEKYVPPTTRVL